MVVLLQATESLIARTLKGNVAVKMGEAGKEHLTQRLRGMVGITGDTIKRKLRREVNDRM